MHYEQFADGTVKCIEDEIPFEVPDGWEWCKLSEVIELVSGQDLEPSRYNADGCGIPYITGASNLENGKVIVNRWTNTPTTHSTKGDLLLTCKGSGVGKMAFSSLEDAHIARQIMALRCYSGISCNYLEIVISALITGITYQANGIIPGIRREIVLNTLIPLPPHEEQDKISRKTKTLRELIIAINVNRDRLMQYIQQAKSRILDLAIRGKLVPQDSNDEPASILVERIRTEKEKLIKEGKIKRDKKESFIFKGEDNSYYEKTGSKTVCIDGQLPLEIPDSWTWCRGYSCFMGMKTKKPEGEFFNYIDIDSIDNKQHIVNQPKHLATKAAPSRANRALQEGSVVFSLVRPYLENVAFIDVTLNDCIASTGFYICNSNGTYYPEFMFYLMISKYVIDGLNQFMKGDNSPSISKESIENWLYPVPPYNEQIAIVERLKSIKIQIMGIETSLT